MNLTGKTAVITGGAKGIGAATALLFAENGIKKIYLVDLDDENGRKMERQLNGGCSCLYIHLDVTDEAGVKEMFFSIDKEGTADILFNCAGITSVKGIMETDATLWNKIMTVNVTSAFLFSKEALIRMERKGYGRIVNVSSISAQVGGIRTSPAYAASKAAILGLTRSFAKYGASRGVTVNTIVPGIADTPMTQAKDFVYSNSEVPMGRAAKPEEIAEGVLFLASDKSAYITGQCLHVNGGMYFG
ncbi:MAG: SDR family oxidoreductase [Treponema sp.]|jgi:3-oxoacyl-[acyl-carrier protein] reductase|nr:SDR family oxidoreductase [Treponema sp.]